MTVHDLQSLHSKYVELAGRFKAAWTFHQFLQGLQKVFGDASIPQYPTDLIEIHVTLKQISESLTGNETGQAIELVEEAGKQLNQTVSVLAATDVRVTPPLLRQFFERVKNYDEQILAQMVRFYMTLAADEGLAGDRLDKVDFLLTKLSEEVDPVSGSMVLRDRPRLRSIFDGFWATFEGLTADGDWIEERKTEIAQFRREVGNQTGLESLSQSELMPRYREAKRLLGRYLFHPDILLTVVETNLAIKNRIREGFREEEERILEESQRILAEGEAQPVSVEAPDLTQLKVALEEFERKQRADNLKLDDLAFLRREVAELRPRLLDARPGGDDELQAETADVSERSSAALVRPFLAEVLSSLEGTNDQIPPKETALSRELYHLRLEAREVVAYRRLHVAPSGDPVLETFLLEAAAVRYGCATEATEISEILDETMVTKESAVFDRARRTTQVAEEYVQRFGPLVDAAIRDGSFAEAQQLQLLRMRLIRDYSGLWLLVHRPTG